MAIRTLTLFAAALFLSVGCGGEDLAEPIGWHTDGGCVEGARLDVLAAELCIFDTQTNPVIETGFSCPTEFPHRFEFGPDVLGCAKDSRLPQDVEFILAERYPELDVQSPWRLRARPMQSHRFMGQKLQPHFIYGAEPGRCDVKKVAGSVLEERSYVYDDTGRLVAEGPDAGITYEYDEFGWLERIEELNGGITELERDQNSRIKVSRFNGVGSRVGPTTTSYENDSTGRRVRVVRKYEDEVIDSRLTWSPDGRTVIGNSIVGATEESRLTFDDRGRRIISDHGPRSTWIDQTTRWDGEVWVGTYYLDGERNGQQITFADYDDEGRPVRVWDLYAMSHEQGMSELSYRNGELHELHFYRVEPREKLAVMRFEGACSNLTARNLTNRFVWTGIHLPAVGENVVE